MRSELHRLVRDFRNYLSAQGQGLTLPGAPPATAEEREPFDKRHAGWRAKRRERAADALRGPRSEPARQPAPARPSPAPARPAAASPTPSSPERSAPQPVQARPAQPTPAPQPTPGRSPAERTAEVVKPNAPKPPPATSSKEKLWLEIGSKPKSTFAAPEADETAFDPDDKTMSNGQKLQALRTVLGDCKRCGLCESRTNLVFGQGNPNARLMFVGESPDIVEDKAGQPMVGDAGDLLNKMISAMGFKREDVYITHVVKCRAIDRDPSDAETDRCSTFIEQQILAIQPAAIVALGRFATQSLLGAGNARPGDWTKLNGIPVMPTFHPEFLLENPEAKRDAWKDLQSVMNFLNSPDDLND